MRAKYLLLASLPAALAGYGAHALLDYRPVAAILVAGVVLMAASELLRVLTNRDF